MKTRLDGPCPKCHEPTLDATIETAAHDDGKLDVIVECSTEDGGCGHRVNGFMSFDEMLVLDA